MMGGLNSSYCRSRGMKIYKCDGPMFLIWLHYHIPSTEFVTESSKSVPELLIYHSLGLQIAQRSSYLHILGPNVAIMYILEARGIKQYLN